MADQETNFLQEEERIYNSMLHHATFSDYRPSSTAAAACISSAERQSPFLNQEPAAKRATPNSDPEFTGFKKIPLPPYIPAASLPPLRRTLSEPIHPPAADNSSAPPPQFSPNSVCPILQPRQESAPSLYRTISDPNPSFNRSTAAIAGTPPLPPGRSNSSRSLESPNFKRLKRMKERLREMSQWANQVSNEDDEEENVESENCCTVTDPKEECENDEAVYVEQRGDCLILHFKCHCGDEYQILLSGNNCFYKLASFRSS